MNKEQRYLLRERLSTATIKLDLRHTCGCADCNGQVFTATVINSWLIHTLEDLLLDVDVLEDQYKDLQMMMEETQTVHDQKTAAMDQRVRLADERVKHAEEYAEVRRQAMVSLAGQLQEAEKGTAQIRKIFQFLHDNGLGPEAVADTSDCVIDIIRLYQHL